MDMATKKMNGTANGSTKQFEKKNGIKDIDVGKTGINTID